MTGAWIPVVDAWAAVWAEQMLQACWQGGLALGLVWVLCRVFPRISPRVRCWIWRLAFVKLLAALLWVTPVELPLLPAPRVVERAGGGQQSAVSGQQSAVSSQRSVAGSPQASAPPRIGGRGGPNAPRKMEGPSRTPKAERRTPNAESPSTRLPLRGYATHTPTLLAALWLLGILWCAVRLGREWIGARRFARRCRPISEEWLVRCGAELCWRFSLREMPALLTADGAGSPLLLGALRPAVVLPDRLIGESTPAELQLMLAHELAHLKRGDLVWGWLPALAHALFFFHPAVWLANREWRLAQEMACDELALEMTQAPAGDYGDVLVKVAAQSRLNLHPAVATVGREESPDTLKSRLVMMKHLRAVSSHRMAAAGLLLALLGAVTVVPWRLVEQAAAAPPAPGPAGSGGASGAGQAARVTPSTRSRSGAAATDRAAVPDAKQTASHPAGALSPSGAAVRAPLPGRSASNPGGPVAAPALRYGWKPGRAYAYAVRIDADEAEQVETLQGSVQYVVRAADAEGFTLSVGGNLFPTRRMKAGMPVPVPPLSPAFGFSALGSGVTVKTDPWGHILQVSGDSRLPFALGDLSRLVLDPLSPDGKDTWEAGGDTNVLLEDRSGPPYGPRFGPRFGPFAPPQTTLPARERSVYTLGARSGPDVAIRKQYELKTREAAAGAPRLQVTGDGTVTFDPAGGIPRALDFKGTLVETTENVTRRTPLRVSCKLQEGTVAAGKAPAPAPPKRLTADECDQIIADLKSADAGRRRLAAGRLTLVERVPSRPDVESALQPLLADSDGFTRQFGVQALAVWGSGESVPALIRLLEDPSFAVQWAAMDALGRLKDRRAVEPLARRVASGKDRAFASRALQAIGPASEEAAVRLLEDPDGWARLEGCRILQAVGSAASLPALRAAMSDRDGLVAMGAKEAVKAVESRR